jgi:hypothetical protein
LLAEGIDMAVGARRDNPLIFLSHSGVDKEVANRLARAIERDFIDEGFVSLRVFNTSETQYRFTDLSEVLRPGKLWRPIVARYEGALRNYLRDHLSVSSAYLLLVTKDTLYHASEWVQWEAKEATELAREHGVPFAPCFVGVRFGEFANGTALSREVGEFQGKRFEVDDPIAFQEGVHELVQDLTPRLL